MSKPPSGSSLNTNGPFYTNLLAVWGLLEGTGGTSVDSFGSNTLTKDGSATWGTDSAGDICVTTAAPVANPLALTTLIDTGALSDWSIAFRAQVVGDNGAVCGDNTGQNVRALLATGGIFGFKESNVSQFFVETPNDYSLMHDYVATGEANTLHHFYVDGVENSESPFGTGVSTAVFDRLMSGNSGSTGAMQGNLSYFYIWSGRILSPTEAATLYADPYAALYGSRLLLIP